MAFFHFEGNGPAGQGDPQPHVVWQQREKKARKPRKAIGNGVTRTLINLGVTLLFAVVYFYVALPPMNLHSEECYVFLFLCCGVYCVCALLTSGFQGTGAKGYFQFAKKQCAVPFFLAVALIVTIAIGSLVSMVIFRAGAYSKLLPLESGTFAEDIQEVSYDRIPMLDRDSAQKLGDRKLGELSDCC